MDSTKATFARHVSRIVRRATLEAGELAEGMFNPLFCSDSAVTHARSFCDELRRELDHIETWYMKAESGKSDED